MSKKIILSVILLITIVPTGFAQQAKSVVFQFAAALCGAI
jgi:hypothetical protein